MDYSVTYDVSFEPSNVGRRNSTFHGCTTLSGLEGEIGGIQEVEEEAREMITDQLNDAFSDLGLEVDFEVDVRSAEPKVCKVCGGYGYYIGGQQGNEDYPMDFIYGKTVVMKCTSCSSDLDVEQAIDGALTGKHQLKVYEPSKEEDELSSPPPLVKHEIHRLKVYEPSKEDDELSIPPPPVERQIHTSMHTVQDIDEYLDVDCYAGYAPADEWKIRVWLNKKTSEIVTSEFIEYSDGGDFDKVKAEDVPADIQEALEGRVEAAKDEILGPALEELKKSRSDVGETPDKPKPDHLALRCPNIFVSKGAYFTFALLRNDSTHSLGGEDVRLSRDMQDAVERRLDQLREALAECKTDDGASCFNGEKSALIRRIRAINRTVETALGGSGD